METPAETRNHLLIPGIPTLRKSIVPPITVQLPIEASCSRAKNFFVGVFWLFCSFAMLATAATFFAGAPENQHSLVQKAMMIALQLFGLWWAPFFLMCALLAFRDACRIKPVLIVRLDRLVDNRSGLSVKWADILSVRPVMTRAGYWGVTLQVRHRGLFPKSVRVGYPMLRRRRDEAHIQCNFLSVPPYQIVSSILTLAQQGGAEIFPPRSVLFWNSPPPTILRPPSGDPLQTN
ncbi:hypothetical protein LB515_18645 [Mesorhizobium sp. CA15]|uniref:hypothetical protein n=1 Tax=Mesorhizobium sp. CA15 TaxID=2876641 RepID=UPI001CD147B2|nr:hypothetical protein [Mesorhizobium sp. CA15]MBZ9867395.1 hypothetical protein [Mesorhizobium sp. CA15]